MKRISFGLILVLVGVLLFSQNSNAYYINDTFPPGPYTSVQVYRDGAFQGNADEIDTSGDPWEQSVYQTFGIDYVQIPADVYLTIQIYTNYPSGGLSDAWNTRPGDFGIDLANDGFCELFVPLYPHDGLTVGGLYNASSWRNAVHYQPAGDHSYYGNDDVTAINSGSLLGMETVSWNGIGSFPNYRVDITLDVSHFLPLPFDGDIGVYWSTATCANDVIAGTIPAFHTPEPSTWFLLGSGLVGLLVFRVRKRHHI